MKIAWPRRFTLRAIFALTTLGCIILAGWVGTERHTAEIRNSQFIDTYTVAPFVFDRYYPKEGKRRFFLWCFGVTMRIPYEVDTPIFSDGGTFPFP